MKTGIFILYTNGDVQITYRPFGGKHLIKNEDIQSVELAVSPGIIHQVRVRITKNDGEQFFVMLKKASRPKYAGSPSKKVPPVLSMVYGDRLKTLNTL